MTNEEVSPQSAKEVRKSIADWFLEVSALLVVFPWLDQLVFHPKGVIDWYVVSMALCSAGGLFWIGIGLLLQSSRARACVAGLGSVLLIGGFLILLGR
jgi:hypothetical protein